MASGHKAVKERTDFNESAAAFAGVRLGNEQGSIMSEAAGTALVTGGARRIGRAIVEDLAAHGFAVAIHCNRSRGEAEALSARITASGGRAAVSRPT